MRNREECVHFVRSILILPKWKATILFLGVVVVKLFMKICRCFVGFVIILRVIGKRGVLGGGSPLGEGVAENRGAGCSEGKAFPSFLFICTSLKRTCSCFDLPSDQGASGVRLKALASGEERYVVRGLCQGLPIFCCQF